MKTYRAKVGDVVRINDAENGWNHEPVLVISTTSVECEVVPINEKTGKFSFDGYSTTFPRTMGGAKYAKFLFNINQFLKEKLIETKTEAYQEAEDVKAF